MPSIRIHLYLVLLLSARWRFGAIYESIADLPKHKSFDFIVIRGESMFKCRSTAAHSVS
jgi:hypothetical protein